MKQEYTQKQLLQVYKLFNHRYKKEMLIIDLLDKGAEFRNKLFKNFCKKSNIKFLHNETSYHAGELWQI